MPLNIASNRLKVVALLILHVRWAFSIICYECSCDGCKPKAHSFCHDPSAYIMKKTRVAGAAAANVKRSDVDVQVVNSTTYRCYTFAWDENRGGSWVKVIKRAVMDGDADMVECEGLRTADGYKNVVCQGCGDGDFCNSAPVSPIRYCYRCECDECTVERDGDCIFAKRGRTPRVALAVPGELCGRVTWTRSDGRWYVRRDAVANVDDCERLKEDEAYIHVGCDACLDRDFCNGVNLKERIVCYECEDCPTTPRNETATTPPGSSAGSCVFFVAETSANETIIERGRSTEPHYCHNISTRLQGNVTRLKCIECFRSLCNDRSLDGGLMKPPGNLSRRGRQEVVVFPGTLSPTDDEESAVRNGTSTRTQPRATTARGGAHPTENMKGRVIGESERSGGLVDPCESTTVRTTDPCATEPPGPPPTPSEVWITTRTEDPCATVPATPPTPAEQQWIVPASTQGPCVTEAPPTPAGEAWIPTDPTADPCATLGTPPTPLTQKWMTDDPCSTDPAMAKTEPWLTPDPCPTTTIDPCAGRRVESWTKTTDRNRAWYDDGSDRGAPATGYPPTVDNNNLGTDRYGGDTNFPERGGTDYLNAGGDYSSSGGGFRPETGVPDGGPGGGLSSEFPPPLIPMPMPPAPEPAPSAAEPTPPAAPVPYGDETPPSHGDELVPVHRRIDPLCYTCDNCSAVDSRTRLVRMYVACYTEVLRKFQNSREWAVSVRRGTGNDPIGANFMKECRQKKLRPMYRNVICLECKANLCNGQSFFQRNERVTCFDCYNCFGPGEKDDFVDTTGGCLLETGKRRNLYGGWSTYVVRNTTDDVFRRIGRYNLDLCLRRKQEQFDFADVKCYTCHSDFCNGRPITPKDE